MFLLSMFNHFLIMYDFVFYCIIFILYFIVHVRMSYVLHSYLLTYRNVVSYVAASQLVTWPSRHTVNSSQFNSQLITQPNAPCGLRGRK